GRGGHARARRGPGRAVELGRAGRRARHRRSLRAAVAFRRRRGPRPGRALVRRSARAGGGARRGQGPVGRWRRLAPPVLCRAAQWGGVAMRRVTVAAAVGALAGAGVTALLALAIASYTG